jgi:hypothetical protein
VKFQLPENVSHACRIITVLTNTVNQRESRIMELEEEVQELTNQLIAMHKGEIHD